MKNHTCSVYILTNRSNTVLYTGATSKPLKQRIWEHRSKLVPGFTSKYNVTKLVYFEVADSWLPVFERERQIKAGSRSKKILLIQGMNPEWKDLYDVLE
jgi:putative endonuclease